MTPERLKALREAAHLRQEDLAAKLGVTRPAIANWEGGTSEPRPAIMPLLASALGVSVEELHSDQPATPPTEQPESRAFSPTEEGGHC